VRSDSDLCAVVNTITAAHRPPAANAKRAAPPNCATQRILLKPTRSRKKTPVNSQTNRTLLTPRAPREEYFEQVGHLTDAPPGGAGGAFAKPDSYFMD
jgi:hypothetical protein